MSSDARAADPRRIARYRYGWIAEWLAKAMLVLTGHRILAHRYRSPFGEIDLVARRGKRLAFIEVKRRPTLQEAEGAFTPSQGLRIGRAAEHFLRRHPRYVGFEMGMDLMLVGRWGAPRHLRNAFHDPWDAWRRR